MAERPAPAGVLVVHRDPGLRGRVATALRDRGHEVTAIPRIAFGQYTPAVLVIDHRELPAPTGARVLALVPGQQEDTILAAFAAGADDVLAGPLHTAELVPRVGVLARSAAARPLGRVGPIVIDAAARRVTLAGRRLDLTRREYDLLFQLAAAPGRVFTKQELLRRLPADPAVRSTRRLDTQVARLRRRLGDHRDLLVTVWGVGYRLGGS
ncbi:MAG: response regulator transcription factor [Solirubrobacteraceae bacterium]